MGGGVGCEWKNGKYSGQGIFTYANGDEYEGEWEDDKRQHNAGDLVGE